MIFLLPSIQKQRIPALLEDWRARFPDGAPISGLVDCVASAVKSLGLTAAAEEGDRRKTRDGISSRTVRYYQTRNWISAPDRPKGQRKVLYRDRHLLQMLTAYKLRQEGADADSLAAVSEMDLQQCIAILGGEESADSSAIAEPCKALRILLAPVAGDTAAAEVAEEIVALAKGDPRIAGKITIKVSEHLPEPPDEKGALRHAIREFRQLHGIEDNTLVQVITSQAHSANWFADWGIDQPKDGVIHAEDYETLFGVRRDLVCASYSLLLAFCAELTRHQITPYDLFHMDHPRGCLFDFCQNKADVTLKIRTGDICEECLGKVGHLFTPRLMAAASRFLDVIRSEARVLNAYKSEDPDRAEPLGFLRLALRQRSAPSRPGRLRAGIEQLLFIHSVIAAAEGRDVLLPEPDEELGAWIARSGPAACLGIDVDFDRIGADSKETDSSAFAKHGSAKEAIRSIRSLHPKCKFVRIDAVRLEHGRLVVSGVVASRGRACPWQFPIGADPASLGITDAGVTYATFGQNPDQPQFANVDRHIRIAEADGRQRTVVRLPDGGLIDCDTGAKLCSSTAFED